MCEGKKVEKGNQAKTNKATLPMAENFAAKKKNP